MSLDVGLSVRTYRVWKAVCHGLGLQWDRLSTSVGDPRAAVSADGALWEGEQVVERFHASILRRLAERALEAGEPLGAGDAWVSAGGGTGSWLELDDFLRTMRAHREIEHCSLLVRGADDPVD